ncbi:phage shock protein C (PspC) family protein [Geodermatophilus pulveris]|uniref:Phage shock protein C (PspC) family protein n=1 Tax=Geodermatophilus pulveris TaxID=1564159 RepID=A0A239AVJ7_9ACTN|nr:PspC domain-containing protein [Geodermatophilus pulveris]SNR99352.1 phage shock protein C (PspC) family protein [Geodermatophilus pulveris]
MTSAPPPALPSADPPAADPLPPGAPARPPLRRSRSDKVLGGVSGGLAEYSGIDTLLWRVGFVALALAGPGVPVYLLLWLLMPAGHRSGRPRSAGPPGPRSPVPGLTLAALLIVVGLLAGLTVLTGWDVGPVGFLAPALGIVGLGLVVAAFTGGRRAKGGLIALGAVLSVALVGATADWGDVDVEGVDDRTERPLRAADVRPVYDGGVGDLTLDLSALDVSDLDAPVTTRVGPGVGDVEVLVPEWADVEVEVDSGIGDVDVLDLDSGSGYSRGDGPAAWSGDDRPEIVLTVDAGVGDVEVDRA